MLKLFTSKFQFMCTLFLTGAGLVGCASVEPTKPIVYLLGEVHDNKIGHAQRLEDIEKMSAPWGRNVAIVLEQINRSDDTKAAAQPINPDCQNLDCLLQLITTSGWDAGLYEPVLKLAVDKGWTIYAGNINKSDMSQVMRGGVASVLSSESAQFDYTRFDTLPDAYQSKMIDAMILGHCGLLDEKSAAHMAQIQIARDIWVSSQILAALKYQGRVIVLAGNGHVRKDIGIPFWLARINLKRYSSNGYIEGEYSPENQQFDVVKPLPVANRIDPCESLKGRFHKGSITPKR